MRVRRYVFRVVFVLVFAQYRSEYKFRQLRRFEISYVLGFVQSKRSQHFTIIFLYKALASNCANFHFQQIARFKKKFRIYLKTFCKTFFELIQQNGWNHNCKFVFSWFIYSWSKFQVIDFFSSLSNFWSISLQNESIGSPNLVHEVDSEYETATFGMGCFWGADALFGATKGVLRTKVGYAGGTTETPTYKNM